ncbi:hypothetical protein JEQ12_020245 [Ovis aries]|uniref:Uncharacterized protein n=1 Tax=Ovis aries TaxID=9940 RepID=A0A836CQH9_SHEEP|nr:hypothetical protein JEQ12_020245 [Ovis aries]
MVTVKLSDHEPTFTQQMAKWIEVTESPCLGVQFQARNMTMRVRRPLKGTLRKKIRSYATPSKKVKKTREPNCFLRSSAREKLNQSRKRILCVICLVPKDDLSLTLECGHVVPPERAPSLGLSVQTVSPRSQNFLFPGITDFKIHQLIFIALFLHGMRIPEAQGLSLLWLLSGTLSRVNEWPKEGQKGPWKFTMGILEVQKKAGLRNLILELKLGLEGYGWSSVPPVETLSQHRKGTVVVSLCTLVPWLQCLQGLPSASLAFQSP